MNPAFPKEAGDFGRGEASPGGKPERILAAAQRSFFASGFGAVSMDTIAREAGVSKATVYAHFASKEALFGAVVARESERYFQGFSAGGLDPSDVRGSLTRLAASFVALILSPASIAANRIIIGEVTRFPALGKVFWQEGPEQVRTQIEEFLRAAAASGSLAIADPRRAAEQFVSLARGDTHLRFLLRLDTQADDKAIGEAAAAAVDTFLAAFAAR